MNDQYFPVCVCMCMCVFVRCFFILFNFFLNFNPGVPAMYFPLISFEKYDILFWGFRNAWFILSDYRNAGCLAKSKNPQNAYDITKQI